MSEERRKRQQERSGGVEENPQSRKLMVAGGIVVLLAAAYAAGWHHRNHRYDAMAQCMASKQVKMYGAYWCPHCTDQKEKLGESYRFVYVECGVPGSHAEAAACTARGVKVFPTWEFEDKVLKPGVFSAEELSDKTGCGLP